MNPQRDSATARRQMRYPVASSVLARQIDFGGSRPKTLRSLSPSHALRGAEELADTLRRRFRRAASPNCTAWLLAPPIMREGPGNDVLKETWVNGVEWLRSIRPKPIGPRWLRATTPKRGAGGP